MEAKFPATAIERMEERLKIQAKENPDCVRCQQMLRDNQVFSPRHKPSTMCRSGNKPHCSCGTCF